MKNENNSPDDNDEVQKHLNTHDHMNNELAQEMALAISQDGKWNTVKNTK
jgi:hypothetical protein